MNEILTLQPDVISRLSQGHDATVTGLQAATAAPAGISANVATTHRAPALTPEPWFATEPIPSNATARQSRRYSRPGVTTHGANRTAL
ncbi:type VII secretion target [Mycobacterium sp. 012931]|uniref:type VII secretion target n=1 Tax=Mycobacterium sp. 012931 TaxID=1187065 RepID=UPI0003F58F41|nr:type VII secretion target [Mycobacterium sp. 012931]